MNKNIENEKRLKHALWLLMDFVIHRYLMSNTKGRENGCAKAERHLELSKIYIASRLFISMDKAERHWTKVMKIHDATSVMTSRLNTSINFPIDDECPDYDKYSYKFFTKFIELADEEWEKVKDIEED